jgi:hypothetical protein
MKWGMSRIGKFLYCNAIYDHRSLYSTWLLTILKVPFPDLCPRKVSGRRCRQYALALGIGSSGCIESTNTYIRGSVL